jgi:hypothetical protein
MVYAAYFISNTEYIAAFFLVIANVAFLGFIHYESNAMDNMKIFFYFWCITLIILSVVLADIYRRIHDNISPFPVPLEKIATTDKRNNVKYFMMCDTFVLFIFVSSKRIIDEWIKKDDFLHILQFVLMIRTVLFGLTLSITYNMSHA